MPSPALFLVPRRAPVAAICLALLIGPATAQYAGIDTGSSSTAPALSTASVEEEIRESQETTPVDAGLRPFGANLFTGGFAAEKEDGLNPDYIVSPGDRIELRVWGATEINSTMTVDPKGNIFIPKVGPVTVAGVRNDQLNRHVTASVRNVYTDNVQVYTSLSSTQPVAVFVTGFVRNPGRYVGVASNSILFFIDRAAGVDPDRGSYRDVEILRNGKRIARADLYDFVLSGKLPGIQLKDGDTILVKPRGSTVSVEGDVRNAAVFELEKGRIDGSELLAWARPLASATHAVWTGVRDGEPRAKYAPLNEVSARKLQDGDRLNILSDAHQDVITVKVEGAFEGPSQFVVPKNTRLGVMLDMIAVPNELAAYESVSIRRESILQQQRQTIEESLRRLESAYLRASSQSDEEARIRTTEAQLISDFVKRVRKTEPSGRLVIRNLGNADSLRLQNGDTITIPERTETVLISGEILIPQAVVFDDSLEVEDYIALSGGMTDLGNPDQILIVRQNGAVVVANGQTVGPGDQLLVLPRVPDKNLQFASAIVDVMYKVAIAAGVLVNID